MTEQGNNINVEIRNTFLKHVFDEDDSDLEDWFNDSSDDEINFNDYLPNPRNKRTRVSNFMEVVSEYSNEEFRRHFRLNRTTAHLCISDLEQANVLPTRSTGREKVSAHKAFLMTVWYLANQETYRQLSDRFNVTESAAWKTVRKVTNYLVDRSANVIRWPNGNEAEVIDHDFAEKQDLHGVVGAIDGSHIQIVRKGQQQHAYCNRKGTHSIILQGVVDSKKRFIDVFAGEAGSLHDARVLRRSALYTKATNGTLDFHQRFLLGDSAYPTNLDWLLTPYKDNGNLTVEQRLFNYKHSSTRVVIENAFALLKGRFRRLRFFEHNDIHFVVKAVIAACTLHNICIDNGETLEDIEPYVGDDY